MDLKDMSVSLISSSCPPSIAFLESRKLDDKT